MQNTKLNSQAEQLLNKNITQASLLETNSTSINVKKWFTCQRHELVNILSKHKNIELICPFHGAQYGEIKVCDSTSGYCLAIMDSPFSTAPMYLTDAGFANAQLSWEILSPYLTINQEASRVWFDDEIEPFRTAGWFQNDVEINCPRHKLVKGKLIPVAGPDNPLPPVKGPTTVLKLEFAIGQKGVDFYLTGDFPSASPG